MAADHELSPSVTIAEDKATAALVVPAGCDCAALNEPTLLSLIRGAGVEVSDFTTKAIKNLIANPPQANQGQCFRIQIARAQPPEHGADGSIQWYVDEKTDNQPAQHKPTDDQDSISFYDRCTFVMVKAGDTIAKIHPAVIGQDGRDVTGKTIPARSAKDAVLQTDDSIMRKADGSLVAQQDGVLYREPAAARIRKLIEIKDYVDFSTGNIEFDGDVTIAKGVRDCFTVKVTGSVEVRGLIEAATIQTGKDLLALGGFAGREHGHVFVGGSLYGRYLDNVHGHVKHDLCVDREIINCQLDIEGRIASPAGSIIGGKITPTGEVQIGTLGSDAGVHTELILGAVPVLEPFAHKLARIVESYAHDKQKLVEEHDLINRMSTKGHMTATDKQRQTQIMAELSHVDANLNKARRTLENIQNEIVKRRRVDITVLHTVSPGVVMILDGCRYKIHQWVKGPVRFHIHGRQFVYRQGDAPPQPIINIADASAILPNKNAA